MYRLHMHWFKLSVETFDALHYVGMSLQKWDHRAELGPFESRSTFRDSSALASDL
jgi:hypothetical protein